MNLPRLTYEQSKRAYELGFAEITNWWLDKENQKSCHINDMGGVFKNHYANPENAMFLQWCRENHDLYGNVDPYFEFNSMVFRFFVLRIAYGEPYRFLDKIRFKSYLQAETALIDYLLDLLEKKTK